MPRNTREYLKRHNVQMVNDLDRAIARGMQIREIYAQGEYKQIGFYEQITTTLIEIRDLLEQYAEENV